MEVRKAVLTESKVDDCCYLCDEFIPQGTRCVVVTLFAPNITYWGKGVKVHMHQECWQKAGKYPALKRNPPLVVECKMILKGTGRGPNHCMYCGEIVETGEKCIAVKTISRNVYGNTETHYIHIPCWEKAGRYPPLSGLILGDKYSASHLEIPGG